MMSDLFSWIHALLGEAPAGMQWFEYVIVAAILLIIIDVILTLIIGAIQSIITGGRK